MISFIEIETVLNVNKEVDALYDCGYEVVHYNTMWGAIPDEIDTECKDLAKHDSIIVYTYHGKLLCFAIRK